MEFGNIKFFKELEEQCQIVQERFRGEDATDSIAYDIQSDLEERVSSLLGIEDTVDANVTVEVGHIEGNYFIKKISIIPIHQSRKLKDIKVQFKISEVGITENGQD